MGQAEMTLGQLGRGEQRGAAALMDDPAAF
jgi:hypothetical protein